MPQHEGASYTIPIIRIYPPTERWTSRCHKQAAFSKSTAWT